MPPVPHQQDSPHRQARLIALAGSLLIAGLAIYLTARPASLFGPLAPAWHLPASVPPPLRTLLGSAPTFVHVIAFILITAALVRRDRRATVLVCGAWALTEILFEILQLRSLGGWLLAHEVIRSAPFATRHLAGTFDPLDILAALLGAALSARFLTLSRPLSLSLPLSRTP